MSVVAFDVVDEYIRPARSHNGRLYPSHAVFGQERCGVAPKVVVGKAHGYAILVSFTPGIVPATTFGATPQRS